MATIPTVRVRHPDGYMVINESDYDAGLHELVDASDSGAKSGDGGAVPDGYVVEHAGGKYYRLLGPDGEVIEGPANGKWEGSGAAEQAARDHAYGPEAPRG